MIELHERLSEFSYGYGVTREVELLLSSLGIKTVPFLPSLIHEDEVGFDVGFDKPGVPLLLQFKLGQSVTRFRRKYLTQAIPYIARPFWRFRVDTLEPDGQFETLLKAEHDGADVYYVAPRFSDWPQYADLFQVGAVLDNSLLLRPSDIRSALVASGEPDGAHRVIYDDVCSYVCSEPSRVKVSGSRDLASRVLNQLNEVHAPLSKQLRRVYDGLADRTPIRRTSDEKGDLSAEVEETYSVVNPWLARAHPEIVQAERRRRLDELKERSATQDDAIAAALGFEFWTLGIQLVLVTSSTTEIA